MTVEQSVSYLECVKDSPTFRCNLDASFKRINDFHEAITDISDSFSQSIKSGITFSCNYQSFCGKLSNLQGLYRNETKFQSEIAEAVDILSAFKENFSILIEGFHLLQREFKVFSETFKQVDTCRKQWQKMNDNHDVAVQKSAAIPRLKLSESQEVDKVCSTIKADYQQCSLKYLTVMEQWDVGRQSRLLRVCSAIGCCEREYYKRCSDAVGQVCLWEQQVNAQMAQMDGNERRISIADYDSRRVSKLIRESFVAPLVNEGKNGKCVIEGYLYKGGRKSWQKWQRRWFKVEQNRLLWCKRSESIFSVLEEDLRICTAKELPDYDRRFCFELIGPERSLVLQADDEEQMRSWVQCLKSGMSNQMGTLHTPTMAITPLNHNDCDKKTISNEGRLLQKSEDRKSRLIEELLQVRGNNLCCDCGDLKPRWSSSSLGITLCTECSGSHRSLGVHVSKVRSITLDNWEPEMLSVMFLLGNEVVNFIYESDRSAIEAAVAEGIVKPDSNTDMGKRKLWTKAKWAEKRFLLKDIRKLLVELETFIRQKMPLFADCLRSDSEFGSVNDLLRYGLEIHCVPIMMMSLTLGADPNGDDNSSMIPLHVSAASDFWPGCEFLILNGAKIDLMDQRKRTALHIACEHENVLVVWLLLKRGARQNIRSEDDKDALHVAIRTANANTVTLLRLHTLNENTKEANLGSAGDETVNDVFRDFTNRAFDQLEEWFISNSDSFHRMNSSKSLSNTVAKM